MNRKRELLPDDMDLCVKMLIEAYNPPPWNDHWTEERGKKYLSDFISSGGFRPLLESDDLSTLLVQWTIKIWLTKVLDRVAGKV